MSSDDDDGPGPVRPDAIRVGRRALALYAVASRASFEWAAPVGAGDAYRTALLEWVAARQIDGELEPHERQLLAAPVGTVEAKLFIAAMWRAEGAAVLAAALGLSALPAIDRNAGLPAIGEALYDELPWGDLQLRDADQISQVEAILYNVNWRVNHYRRDPMPCDLRAMLRDYGEPPTEFGPIKYAADGDLAVDELAFTAAPADRRAQCTRIVIERRRAATWLCGDDPTYSQVDMDT